MRADQRGAGADGDGEGSDGPLAASRHDPDRFVEVYDRWVGPMTTWFFHRTACRDTAADLTSETFAQAFATRHRFRPDRGRADQWLFGIARHQFGAYLRRARVDDRARRRLGIDRVELDDASLDAIVEREGAGALFEALREALATLSPGVAEAVRLRVGLELEYPEVARRLGCREGAARVRVARGLAQLHDLMGAQA